MYLLCTQNYSKNFMNINFYEPLKKTLQYRYYDPQYIHIIYEQEETEVQRVKWLAQYHTADTWQGQNTNPGKSGFKICAHNHHINELLLHNKQPPNSEAYNTNCLFFFMSHLVSWAILLVWTMLSSS